ncbi:hypothetical protein BUALT_Bualt15G0113800 [Buddleja alternifolia]|uniref:UspA domain-containing protein n=1 Tax=Buddleja alternifolia TaxID=168488 RepID=A0AAV6WEP5_9LAMI|nr:hypothetical protein BUALT_Bualt15G0113800 [Buddleja alternifolia]
MAEKGRKLLVAVDASDESAYALSWCLNNIVSQQISSKDTLILLFAKTPLAVNSAMDSTGYMFSSSIITTMEKYGNEVAQSVMEKATRLCKDYINDDDQVKVETLVEHGDQRDVICEVAERLKVDLLIMGSHGYGLIKRAFLGSVSNHCAQNVKCPVLIVKKPKSEAADH